MFESPSIGSYALVVMEAFTSVRVPKSYTLPSRLTMTEVSMSW